MAVFVVAAAASGLATACGAPDAGETIDVTTLSTQPAPNVDPRRSLAITDQPILVNFGLDRVMNQLITTSGVTGLTATALFQQWWDTLNPSATVGATPHCNDMTDGQSPLVNGYPYQCRPAPAEGFQSACDPFAPNSACSYMPIGLFMRFDLAPANGNTCGEYRVIFAKTSGRTETQNRNLLIFEAAMPNPHIEQGIRGCEKYVRTWAELSLEPDMDKRRASLESLYFSGYKEFAPVLTWDHFGANTFNAGQVRTNSFVQPDAPRIWSLREFKVAKVCAPTCTLQFKPVSDKTNPYGPLFDVGSTNVNAAGFQAEFLTQIPSLAAADANGISMQTSDVFNSAQSQATGQTNETNYFLNFPAGPNAFRSAIESTLASLGSTLTADEIVKRAQVTACAGCHKFSNGVDLGGSITWPQSLGFTHISERDADLETVGSVTRFKISDALTNLLLPHRKQLAEDFLNNVPLPARNPSQAIGGRNVE